MKLRVKHTFMYGEVTNVAGSSDNPMIELTMRNGSKLSYPQEQLSSNPPFIAFWNVLDKIKKHLTP